MGLFKSASDSLKRRQFIIDLNQRFKRGYVVNQDDYLVTFKTTITLDGLFLRGVIMNDNGLQESTVGQIGHSLLRLEMIKRELFALGFVGLQIVGKNQSVGLRWRLSDLDSSLKNDHPYLSMFGAAGQSVGQIIDDRKNQKDRDVELEREVSIDLAKQANNERLEREEQERLKNEKANQFKKNCSSCGKVILKTYMLCPYCNVYQTEI